MISSVLKVVQGLVKIRNSSGTVIDPATSGNQSTIITDIGTVTETAPGTDTASSGLNGRLQRVAQRLTTLITTSTDRTQKTQLTDGTNDLTFRSVPVTLTDLAVPVRPIPYEPQSYSSCGDSFVPVATATDVFTITGSATKTVRIHKIDVTGTTTSGSAIKITIKLIKRSTANTGGTSTTPAVVPHDSNNAAGTAVTRAYTANPTLGTTVGNIRTNTTSFQASGVTDTALSWDFADDGGQPIVLRGTSEILAVNFNSTTVTGGVVSISAEWSEV